MKVNISNVGGEGGAIRQFDVLSGDLVQSFTGHRGFVDQLLLSEDGKSLVSASHQGDRPGSIRVWNTTRGDEQAFIAINEGGQGTRILFGRSDDRLLVMNRDGSIQEYDTTSGTALNRTPAPATPLTEPGSKYQLLVTPEPYAYDPHRGRDSNHSDGA